VSAQQDHTAEITHWPDSVHRNTIILGPLLPALIQLSSARPSPPNRTIASAYPPALSNAPLTDSDHPSFTSRQLLQLVSPKLRRRVSRADRQTLCSRGGLAANRYWLHSGRAAPKGTLIRRAQRTAGSLGTVEP
jgi:hypothetical protein